MGPDEFFGLEPTDDPRCWHLPVVPKLCSSIGTLFGGIGLGASIEVLERAFGRPLVWASAQFLSFAPQGTTVEIRVEEVVRGHQISQVRAVGTTGDDEIFTVNAATGQRQDEHTGTWTTRPEVPPPEDCPPRVLRDKHRGTLIDHIEMRLASARSLEELPGPPGDGRSALWVRLPDLEASPSVLGIFGDYVPFGISQTLGQPVGGNSLDNTLRVVHGSAEQWVLADVAIHALRNGFAHGIVHLWGQDGALLATASQSTIVRPWSSAHRARR